MRGAIDWFNHLKVPFDGDVTIRDIINIQEDAMTELQSRIQQLEGENAKFRETSQRDDIVNTRLNQRLSKLTERIETLESENKRLTQSLAEEQSKLSHVLTSMEEGSLPWWQSKHDKLAIQLAESTLAFSKQLTDRDAAIEKVKAVLKSYTEEGWHITAVDYNNRYAAAKEALAAISALERK